MFNLKLAALLVCLCMPALARETLRVAVQEMTPPKFIISRYGISGLCPDILSAIENIDPQLHFELSRQSVPVSRIEYELEKAQLDMACALLDSPARHQIAWRISTPLYVVKERLIARKNDPVRVNNFAELAALNELVATSSGAAYISLLNKHGIRVDDSSGDNVINLKKVINKRVRFFYMSERIANHLIKENELQNKVRLLPAVMHQQAVYLWLGKHASQETRQRLEHAVKTLKANGQLQLILQGYPVAE